MRVRSAIVRPWLKAGLSALLVESAQRVAELRGTEETSEAAAASAPPACPAEQRSAGSSRSEAFRASAQGGVRAPSAGRPGVSASAPGGGERFPNSAPAAGNVVSPGAGSAGRSVSPGAQASAGRPSGAASPARQAAPSDNAGILATPGARPVEQWPASWLALKNRRPLPPRPLVLWTYAGLGEDLTGTPDEVRRRVIVRMLMELHHPGGTHVFWPCGLAGEKPEDGPALFWSGVRLLNPRVLLLFGSDARDTLSMPKTLLPFCQERVFGRLVIQLPRPQALAADEASFKRALAFLSRLLRFCARRQA